ncbi:putative shikimate kinase [Maribacter sp. HTCC2170]|nr:putative shikimate kinase [Maribacter sp. HTCC2170]
MGSGKSTIGRLLANELNYDFIDLDDFIESNEQMKIPMIFESKGEIYFRKKEFEYLKQILANKDNFILATGGGTPCYGENMSAMLEATSNVFYLKVSISRLIDRLVLEKEHRPLITNIPDEELPEFIGKHLFERSYFYSKANNSIFCDEKKADEIRSEIEGLLV